MNSATNPAATAANTNAEVDPRDACKSPELTGAALSKAFRDDIKAAIAAGTLPKGKYSVRMAHYGSYRVTIALPVPMINRAFHRLDEYRGEHYLEYDRERGNWELDANGTGNWRVDANRYTPEAKAALAAVKAIVLAYYWDKSDLQSDYHNSRFYYDISLDTDAEQKAIVAELVAAAQAMAAEQAAADHVEAMVEADAAPVVEEAPAAEDPQATREIAERALALACAAIFANPTAPMGTSADSRYNDGADRLDAGDYMAATMAALDSIEYSAGPFSPAFAHAAAAVAPVVESLCFGSVKRNRILRAAASAVAVGHS